ncbi:hypothetical protein Tco_0714190, partial [Tanacetum coccineum]
MIKQERESILYDEFDKFTSKIGESFQSYYLRFAKLINDMNMIPMSMTPMQINTKFVNHLQPEWSRFVTAAKQARNLHSVTFDQLYAFLKHNERDAKESSPLQSYAPTVVKQPPTFQPDTGLAIPTFLPTDDPIASLNKAMLETIKLQEYGLSIKLEIQGQINQGTRRGVVLDEEQQDYLADSLEETDDCKNLQLQATLNFKADHVDAYDLDYDDEATANVIFMANLSHVGSLNDDTVAPRYDSDTLSKVPHYDTYHDFDVINSNIQELGYIENIVSTNESYDKLKGNSDVIFYTDYMLTIRDDVDNYVPPPIQKNDMMLFVIKQMKYQVEKCNKVNQEAKSVNESLTSELERYK